jgi:hydrogenase/urease accessory protein HupE
VRLKDAVRAFGTVIGFSLVLTSVAGSAYGLSAIRVPEIEPGLIGSAVALLVGGYLVLVSRARK